MECKHIHKSWPGRLYMSILERATAVRLQKREVKIWAHGRPCRGGELQNMDMPQPSDNNPTLARHFPNQIRAHPSTYIAVTGSSRQAPLSTGEQNTLGETDSTRMHMLPFEKKNGPAERCQTSQHTRCSSSRKADPTAVPKKPSLTHEQMLTKARCDRPWMTPHPSSKDLRSCLFWDSAASFFSPISYL